MADQAFTAIMKFKKSTSGTHVYVEVDINDNVLPGDEAHCPSIYFKKHALPVNPPQYLTVTVAPK